MELRCCFKKTTELPPLPKRKHVRGRRPHDPVFDVRTALYLMLGLDLTAMEGLDEHFTSWLGLCPQFKKTGGTVQSSRTRRGKGRAAYTFRLRRGA